MGDDKKPKYVITAALSPRYMSIMFNNKWCASPDGMTAQECAAVTQTMMSKQIFFGKVSNCYETVIDMRFFSQIKTLSYEMFGYSYVHGILYCPPNLVSCGQQNAFRATRCSRYYFPASVTKLGASCAINTTGDFVFYSDTPPTDLGSNISNMQAVYCPDEAIETYKAAAGSYESRVHPISEIGVGDVYKDFK